MTERKEKLTVKKLAKFLLSTKMKLLASLLNFGR